MKFSINASIEILERTPLSIENLLNGISSEWTSNNEGGETWSVYDVVGHLIQGEKADWMKRVEIILAEDTDKKFNPFDRFAQFESSKGKNLSELLKEFILLRKENLRKLKAINIYNEDFLKTAIHPEFGIVTLSQLISAWVVHDLDHIAQIARIMSNQYKSEVGPWIEYLRILKTR